MKIAIAGLGYVGMSLAVLLARNHHVVAVDVVLEKVEAVNRRQSPFVDADIDEYLAKKNIDLIATMDEHEAYATSEIVIIATPTNYDPKQNHFGTSCVERVVELVLENNPDAVIVIKRPFQLDLRVRYARDFLKGYFCSHWSFA